ncbi:hypothetical protein PI125_g3097 [Phytophthora idaei]|nr:hypothetical protein PI125_g3097 [Phytophthora idaei]KAG3171951.1 hypothetical protein PI126_g1595 [Phytophthora idaei]
MPLGFGALIESLKAIPDVKTFGGNVQTLLFEKWIKYKLASRMDLDRLSTKLINTDPRYGNLKAYTEYYYGYAKHQGGTDLLKKVETLIIDGKLHATIAVASNSVAKNSS